MCKSILASFVFALLLWRTAAAAEPAVRLTKGQREAIEQQVIPVYRLGDPLLLLQTLSPIVARLDDERLPVVNEFLAGQGIPTVERLLLDSRLTLIQQQLNDRLPMPKRFELILTLRSLDEKIREVFRDQDRHPAMSDPLTIPNDLAQFKQLFWEVHVLDNRLKTAIPLAEYAAKLAEQASRLNPTSLDEQLQKLIKTDFDDVLANIKRRRQELEEREIELRIYRIEAAADVLANDQDKKLRFLAAYNLDLDGELVDAFFQERLERKDAGYIRQDLSAPSIQQSVQATVKQGRATAGDVVEKTKLLYTGLHWWLRGRYGAGPNAFGLLKSESALSSTDAQFPLFMPMVTPKPTDPTNAESAPIPEVDRRHHYDWAVEHRPITSNASGSSRTVTSRQLTGEIRTTHMSQFY